MAGRRAARRTALVLLYQWDVTGQPLASLYEGDVDEYARELAEAVVTEAPALDEKITASAEGWTATGSARSNGTSCASASTSSRAERAPEVAVDEAVELSKRYASDEAGRLVNGILGRILRERAA